MDRRRILLVVAVLVAALGAGLVFVYAQTADKRAQDNTVATTRILVATQQIEAGEVATDAYTAGKIAFKDVPSDTVLPDATGDPNLFAKKVALTTIYPGEQLLTDRFGASSAVTGKQILSPTEPNGSMTIVLADPNHVGPFLTPGSHVGIFYTPDGGTTTDASGGTVQRILPSICLFDNMLVQAVGSTLTGQTATDENGNPVAVAPTTQITVSVNQKEAELLGSFAYGNATGAGGGLFMVLKTSTTKIKSDIDIDAFDKLRDQFFNPDGTVRGTPTTGTGTGTGTGN